MKWIWYLLSGYAWHLNVFAIMVVFLIKMMLLTYFVSWLTVLYLNDHTMTILRVDPVDNYRMRKHIIYLYIFELNFKQF